MDGGMLVGSAAWTVRAPTVAICDIAVHLAGQLGIPAVTSHRSHPAIQSAAAAPVIMKYDSSETCVHSIHRYHILAAVSVVSDKGNTMSSVYLSPRCNCLIFCDILRAIIGLRMEKAVTWRRDTTSE